MKKLLLLFCCTILLLTACSPETRWNKDVNTKSQEDITGYLKQLTSEKMAGREGGQRGEALTALYLAGLLQKNGLKPAGDGGTYYQSFSIGGYSPVMVDNRMTFRRSASQGNSISENVLGLLEGVNKKEVIVVSAHYDHLGTINGKLYPGANDNASGTAAVLRIMDGLKEKQPDRTILFAFWGSEEKGLLGSNYFCEHPTIPLGTIKGVINLDSVGNVKEKKLIGWREDKGGDKDSAVSKLLKGLQEKGWKITFQGDGSHSSDQAPFNKKGIPGFTLLSPYWLEKNHTVEDTVQGINMDYLDGLSTDVVDLLRY